MPENRDKTPRPGTETPLGTEPPTESEAPHPGHVGPEDMPPMDLDEHGHEPETEAEKQRMAEGEPDTVMDVQDSQHHPANEPLVRSQARLQEEVEEHEYPTDRHYWVFQVEVKPGWPMLEATITPQNGPLGEVHLAVPVADSENPDHVMAMFDSLVRDARNELRENLNNYSRLRRQDDDSWR